MVLDEGRNREIRRLLARVGHKVQRLTRIAVGPVRLGDLPPGAVRLLTKQEISALRQAIAEPAHARRQLRKACSPNTHPRHPQSRREHREGDRIIKATSEARQRR